MPPTTVPVVDPPPALAGAPSSELKLAVSRPRAPSRVFVFHDGENAYIPPSLTRGGDLVDATLQETLRLCNVPEGTVDSATLTVEWKLFLPETGNDQYLPCDAAKEQLKVEVDGRRCPHTPPLPVAAQPAPSLKHFLERRCRTLRRTTRCCNYSAALHAVDRLWIVLSGQIWEVEEVIARKKKGSVDVLFSNALDRFLDANYTQPDQWKVPHHPHARQCLLRLSL